MALRVFELLYITKIFWEANKVSVQALTGFTPQLYCSLFHSKPTGPLSEAHMHHDCANFVAPYHNRTTVELFLLALPTISSFRLICNSFYLDSLMIK